MPGILKAGTDPLESVANELAKGIPPKAIVAVLAPTYPNGYSTEGPFLVSERLTTYLCRCKYFIVVERDQVLQLLSELHLSETGILDPKSVKRIGEMLGANVIVTGTLIDVNSQDSELNARALLPNNGRVLSASRAILNRTWGGRHVLGWNNK